MQKKKARKGFLFLRRESVLPPCRAGPVCPAGTNAVFCGGTHGSRPTDRCGKPSVGDGVLQWSAAEQMPLGYDVPSARQRRAARPPLGGGCRRGRLGERNCRAISLPPSALHAATSLAEGGKGKRIPTPVRALARNDRGTGRTGSSAPTMCNRGPSVDKSVRSTAADTFIYKCGWVKAYL